MIWMEVIILHNDRTAHSLQSHPCQLKVGPVTVINRKLHGGRKGRMVWPRDLGGCVTVCPTAALNVATTAENKAAQWRPRPPARSIAVSNPCTMTRLFTHAVKQDATHWLFTAVAHSILQMCSTNAKMIPVISFENQKRKTKNDNRFFDYWFTSLMQIICTSLQTDNHASTSLISFYRSDALPAAKPTASVTEGSSTFTDTGNE